MFIGGSQQKQREAVRKTEIVRLEGWRSYLRMMVLHPANPVLLGNFRKALDGAEADLKSYGLADQQDEAINK